MDRLAELDEQVKDKPISEYPVLLGVPTHVLKYGKEAGDILVLVLPGNPGVIQYYEDFMYALHQCSQQKISVWGISHAGHVNIPEHRHIVETIEDPYTLEGQIKHKLIFILEHVPETTKIIFIGHSIGCYIALELFRHLAADRILKAILLFPTIERMAASPQGMKVTPLLKYLRWAAVPPIYVASFLPNVIQEKILGLLLYGRDIPKCALDASKELFNTKCAQNSLYMAKDEMEKVTELHHRDVIAGNLDKILFYYGSTDQWCPVSYYEDMREAFPSGAVFMCGKGFEHAFVLSSSVAVGQLTWSWIKDMIETHNIMNETDQFVEGSSQVGNHYQSNEKVKYK